MEKHYTSTELRELLNICFEMGKNDDPDKIFKKFVNRTIDFYIGGK